MALLIWILRLDWMKDENAKEILRNANDKDEIQKISISVYRKKVYNKDENTKEIRIKMYNKDENTGEIRRNMYNTSKSPSLVQLGAGLPLDSNAPSALINDSPTELRQN